MSTRHSRWKKIGQKNFPDRQIFPEEGTSRRSRSVLNLTAPPSLLKEFPRGR
ncbi:MAG: hypothetical protein SXA11_13125 [Cyanobacteriota bacterium]|nr:hypothetical protein [Cyanobacteriota bacterium]